MPPRARRVAASLEIKAHLLRHKLARRWVALVLFHIGGWSVLRIKKILKGTDTLRLRAFAERFMATGGVDDSLRRSRGGLGSSLTQAQLTAVQVALCSGGPGGKKQSLKRALPKLKSAGTVTQAMTTVRCVLKSADWSSQRVRKALVHKDADRTNRQIFAGKEARTISTSTAFSDSKVFEGEASAQSSLGYVWAPNGEPVVSALKARSAYKVHMYATVTQYGATTLYEAKGTTQVCGRGHGRGCGCGALAGGRGRGGVR